MGLFAEALRNYFCTGADAVLLKSNIREKIYPAFAAIGKDGPARTELMYTQWVEKLATKEYADELVLLAVALELSVCLVVIPYTPESSDRPWVITTYEAPSMKLDGASTIYFGNNGVHYVYLPPPLRQG